MKSLSQEAKNDILYLIIAHREKFTRTIIRKFPQATTEIIEDCFQDLFVISCTNYKSFNKSKNKIGWLYKTLKNLMFTYFRDPENKNLLISQIPNHMLKNNTAHDNTEEDIIFHAITNNLSEYKLANYIFSQLSEQELLLYDLRYTENLCEKDIALKLKMPYGSVRRCLFDLKRKVRKIIENGVINTKEKNL
ncbi:MAG: sigma-70 family RNA polymerase sigma factor [Clostridia bacterium]|nr:sigma-70 family RNA polymerase sigma factor [Clostridia bacterium]